MAIKQYIGARYVPKFATPIEWQENTAYEGMTIVTYNNSSYTSKKSVPTTVGIPPQNEEYWVLTGNYNAQVEEYRQDTLTYKETVEEYQTEITNRLECFISKEKGTDISYLLNEMLEKYETVYLDGKEYDISNTITIPPNKSLYGNGSLLNVKNDMEWAVIVRDSDKATTQSSKQSGLYDLSITCYFKSSGVMLGQANTCSNVKVIQSNLCFQSGDHVHSLDNRFINCKAYASGDVGFNSVGYDSAYINCDTLFTNKEGFILNGGDEVNRCHVYGTQNGSEPRDTTTAFKVLGSCMLDSIYCDSCMTGVDITDTNTSKNVVITNIWGTWESGTSSTKYLININSEINTLSLSGVNLRQRDDVIVLKETSRYWNVNVNAQINSSMCNNSKLENGNACLYSNEKNYTIGNNRIIGIANNISGIQSGNNGLFEMDIIGNGFSITDIKGVFNANGLSFQNEGTFIKGDVTSVTLTKYTSNNEGESFGISIVGGWSPTVTVILRGYGVRYANNINTITPTTSETIKVYQ